MFIVSALSIPVSLLVVRKYIILKISLNAAGVWEGLWRLSAMYLMVLTTAFSTYLLPTFSILTGKRLQEEVFKVLKFVIPLSAFILTSIFILKDWLISLLFTKEFKTMSELFKYQILGDFVKILSWVMGNIIIAKAQTKAFISVQIGWSILFILLSIAFVNLYGLAGVTIAYFISCCANLLFMNIYFKKLLWSK